MRCKSFLSLTQIGLCEDQVNRHFKIIPNIVKQSQARLDHLPSSENCPISLRSLVTSSLLLTIVIGESLVRQAVELFSHFSLLPFSWREGKENWQIHLHILLQQNSLKRETLFLFHSSLLYVIVLILSPRRSLSSATFQVLFPFLWVEWSLFPPILKGDRMSIVEKGLGDSLFLRFQELWQYWTYEHLISLCEHSVQTHFSWHLERFYSFSLPTTVVVTEMTQTRGRIEKWTWNGPFKWGEERRWSKTITSPRSLLSSPKTKLMLSLTSGLGEPSLNVFCVFSSLAPLPSFLFYSIYAIRSFCHVFHFRQHKKETHTFLSRLLLCTISLSFLWEGIK